MCIFIVPILTAMAVTSAVRLFLPNPTNTSGRIGWWLALLTVGGVVAIGVERLARRLLPLAMLLKLSMLFPKQAPSRFRVARTTGTLRQLKAEMDASDGADANDHAARILSLVTMMAAHDRNTRGHSERVRVFTDLLSEELKLSEDDRYRLRWASLLHDIGKLSVDARILNKPSKLNDREWDAIKEHPNDGAALAAPLLDWLGPWGKAIAQHHERYDGGGYPGNLANDQISEAGRIVAVADAYDTMTSARSYQRPKSTASARRELVNCAGGQFDPVIVRAFLEISLPKLLWAVGPVSLLVHLPFLARLQEIGQATVTAAAQTATVTAVVGVTAIGLAGPATVLAHGNHIDRARITSTADGSSANTTPAIASLPPTGSGDGGETSEPTGGVKANDSSKAQGGSDTDDDGEGSSDDSGSDEQESSSGNSGNGHAYANGHDMGEGQGNSSSQGQGGGSNKGQGGGSGQGKSGDSSGKSGNGSGSSGHGGGSDDDDSD